MDLDHDNALLVAPISVAKPEERMRQLVEKANDVTADDSIPIKRYWASAKQILRMANVYLDEKNFEKCFILYMKYIILYIEQLPKHCEYKLADSAEKVTVRNHCTKIIPLAEEVKARIKARYEREYQAYLQEKEAYDTALSQKRASEKRQLEKKKREQSDHFVANLQFELDKKKRELAEHKNNAPSGSVQPGLLQVVDMDEKLFDDHDDDDRSESPNNASEDSTSSPSSAERTIAKPQIDRSTKPALPPINDHMYKDQLSELIVPYDAIIDQFTNLARANTNRNVETCAILAGRLSQNRFTITHLMVPKQSGTADSCCATSEEELIIEQERLQLLTVGWIHTHPSQRSFLSSVDLHTHAPYQKMLPEAIAIVVAPKANEIFIYSLSEHGLDFILRCRKSGFHPHPNEQSLYGEAKHVRIDNSLPVEVIDYR